MNIYAYTSKYTDKFELMKKVLTVNSVIKTINGSEMALRPSWASVLTFYCIYGYSDKTKNLILDSIGINRKNLNQINAQLTKAGYLVKDPNNERIRHLSDEMKELVGYFTDTETNPKKVLMLRFDVR